MSTNEIFNQMLSAYDLTTEQKKRNATSCHSRYQSGKGRRPAIYPQSQGNGHLVK